jgi:hypothetical protein
MLYMERDKSMTCAENDGNTLLDRAGHLQNDARTGEPCDALLTQPRSLDVLARHLARIRPSLPREQQWDASTLEQQCKRYRDNPDGLRPHMLRTIERLEAMTQGER